MNKFQLLGVLAIVECVFAKESCAENSCPSLDGGQGSALLQKDHGVFAARRHLVEDIVGSGKGTTSTQGASFADLAKHQEADVNANETLGEASHQCCWGDSCNDAHRTCKEINSGDWCNGAKGNCDQCNGMWCSADRNAKPARPDPPAAKPSSTQAEVQCGSNEDLDEKCKECSGEHCTYCREEHKVRCCLMEGKVMNTCCKDAPAPIKAAPVCANSAHCDYEKACRGCGGTQCLDCFELERIKCCINGGTPNHECCKYASVRNQNNETLCGCAATAGDKDCSKSRCCQDAQKGCYAKNEHWGTCMNPNSCTPGVHPNDHADHKTPWSCKKLSCAESYKDDCRHSRCCRDSDAVCYLKNEHWASCRPKSAVCKAGKEDPHDPEEHRTPWDCTVLSCAEDHSDDCSKSKCCKNPKSFCYKKNDHWAACKPSCKPGIDENDHPHHKTEWSCKKVTN